jgi:hypothetical protein
LGLQKKGLLFLLFCDQLWPWSPFSFIVLFYPFDLLLLEICAPPLLCFFSFKIEHLLQQFGAARFEFYCGQKRDIVITPPPPKKYVRISPESVCAYL